MTQNDSIKFITEHCEFDNNYSCYVLLAVSRKKDSEKITNSQEVIFREILRKPEDFSRKFNRIKLNCQNYRDDDGESLDFYIYIALNARDARKANRLLMNKLWDCMYEESLGNDRSRILKRVDREFISFLMKPEARTKKRYFHVDFDTKDPQKVNEFEKEIQEHTNIVLKRESRNGYHYKIMPFNIKLIEPKEWFEIKKDSLLFVEYVVNTHEVKEDE